MDIMNNQGNSHRSLTKYSGRRAGQFVLAFCLVIATWAGAIAQESGLHIDYSVKIESITDRLFHLTADIKNIKEPELVLSLPAWTPGWYTIENYAKNVLRFKVSDSIGNRLPISMVHKQSWRVDTSKLESIRVEFDYKATVLALNQARIADDFAFFTGTELYVFIEGHREIPATVRFLVPEGWKIISALKETTDPLVFTAPDYDTLADAPTELGKYDLTKFEVDGKPHYFVTTPKGVVSTESSRRFADNLAKIARSQAAIFGGLPYDKYVYYYFFARAESTADGALEHSNSHVAFAPPGSFTSLDSLESLASHEFFHVWNVKRIRPSEMWPYDYSRENETTLLWVSEGFTNYYGELSLYRAGLMTKGTLFQRLTDAIKELEANEARSYISPADSSISTWLGYDTMTVFGISYYTQGQVLALLLDLSIRQDSEGKYCLDDVMRNLYQEFYQKHRGFTTEDLLSVIASFSKKDYHDFFKKYVSGTQIPQYNTVLNFAGLKLDISPDKIPYFGLSINLTLEGAVVTSVTPNSPAVAAGVEVGDVIIEVGGADVRRGFKTARDMLVPSIGQMVKMNIKRGGIDKSLNIKVGFREEAHNTIIELTNGSPEQIKIREGWLKRNN